MGLLHPTVHDMLGKDLLGPTVSRREVSSGLLKLLAENAGAFIAAALSLVVGLAVLATTLVVAAAAIATGFEPLREDPQMGLVVFVIIVGIVLFLLGGATWSRLKSLYKEHDDYGKKVS